MSPADDRHAIATLVFAYAERIDAGDVDGVATLLRDAVWRSTARPEGVCGIDAIRDAYSGLLLYDGSPRTQHVVTNLVIDVRGDAATARSRFTVLQACLDFPLQPIAAGRYHDAFVRSAEGWRFTERTILLDLVGDLSHHLRPASPSSS
jgi:ketosteroid isomerase-like protein